uniref:Uncharacterized protein n=1 Tax=Knipowitschia caucasica TaxID=637954 RepID=A0AAV2J3A3_KNICA
MTLQALHIYKANDANRSLARRARLSAPSAHKADGVRGGGGGGGGYEEWVPPFHCRRRRVAAPFTGNRETQCSRVSVGSEKCMNCASAGRPPADVQVKERTP